MAMDRRERHPESIEDFRMAFQAMQARMWTSLPGIIKQFPGASGLGKMTVDVQPTIGGLALNSDGTSKSIQMPVLLDCPIVWQGGGGVTATFPIKAGDECLIVLSSRCIDAWWQRGFVAGAGIDPDGVTLGSTQMNPPDLRMHNLSDGFVIVGLRSQPREFAVDTANACLITDDGNTYFKLNPTTHAIAAHATGGIVLNGVTIDSSGNISGAANINASGTVTATTDVVGGGKHLATHVHAGVTAGTASTAPPT